MDTRLGFIGAGNMATALIGGLTAQPGLTHPPVVIDPDDRARAALEAKFPVEAMSCANERLQSCELVVLAVKPQQMRSAVVAAKAHLGQCLVISIAAGIPTASIARWLGNAAPIVRCMPNTPALIGQGVTGLYANALVSPDQLQLADRLLLAVGETVWVEQESLLDAVTAVSGSGPAYVFYFIEALERAAKDLGLSPEASSKLALATFQGATRLARSSKDSLGLLRERVTSKGGTTHAALASLEAAGVAAQIVEAVRAAAGRATEMGEEFGRD